MAESTTAALQELIDVVARLRDPKGGCPWDLEQTHQTLIPYVLEEAYEVADAIRQGDDAHLSEELGDLLLQVVLHAQIASESERFDLEQVARGISAKLIRRHPSYSQRNRRMTAVPFAVAGKRSRPRSRRMPWMAPAAHSVIVSPTKCAANPH